ncbi:nuclear transport factor 2 family protein [Paenibacillus tundrae]|uniref:nuclear transport factor 2 family protein n=1 Tax=Paenibacillus tundrae TaxID=528187 RepID=UPI0030CCBB9C
MERETAVEVINQYFRSWVEKDFNLFVGSIHEEAIVRECTGEVIQGRDELNRWFKQWNGSDNEVMYWDIHNIGFDYEQMTAFVEWKFKCKYKGTTYEWDGTSIVYFENSLIIELNEYEMKKDKSYPYKQDSVAI